MLALETALEAAETLGLALSQSQSASWRHAAEKLKLQLAVFDGRRLHKEYDEYLLRRMLWTSLRVSIGTGRPVSRRCGIKRPEV